MASALIRILKLVFFSVISRRLVTILKPIREIILVPLLVISSSLFAAPLPHVVFIAGPESHFYGEHEFNAGGEILVADLNNSGVVTATLHKNGWPKEGIDANASAIVLYMDGDSSHPALDHMEELQKSMDRGAGLFAMHFAVHVPPEKAGKEFAQWIGGFYNSETSTNPHWQGTFTPQTDNPIFNGVNQFTAIDEFYFNIKFDNPNANPVLTGTPPDEAREHVPHPRRKFYLFGGSVPEEVVNNKGKEETIAWSLERENGGRGFGFTGGHFHWNWGNKDYRRFVLNAIAWTAKAKIPESGIPTVKLTFEELKQRQDESIPFYFNAAATAEKFNLVSRP